MALLAPRASAANLEIRAVTIARAEIRVSVDRVALTQVLLNLLDNALKYAAPGGAIIVTAEAVGGQVELVVAHPRCSPPVPAPTTGLGLRPRAHLSSKPWAARSGGGFRRRRRIANNSAPAGCHRDLKSMQLSSDLWVYAALIRRVQLAGSFATVVRKGDARAAGRF